MSNLPSDQKDNWMNNNTDIDFLDSSIEHDKIFVVEGQKFHVKRELLSFSSEFFQCLFNVNLGFKKANEKEIEIKDVTAKEFKDFLNACYPGFCMVTIDNYRPLLALATRFLSGTVIKLCKKFMMDEFDKLDALDVLEIAFQYDIEELKNKVAISMRNATSVVCSECDLHKCSKCIRFHLGHPHTLINTQYPSFINKPGNIQRIEKMPSEVHTFILHVLLNPKLYTK